jgi:serine/threonine protein kinase
MDSKEGKKLTAGTIVGNYQVGELIADGGMGDVYASSHRLLPRKAAIKVLREEMRSAHTAREGILHEAAVLELIAHPGVARVFDVGVLPDGRPWLAMELVDGEPLAELLRRRGRLTAVEVADLMLQLLAPLGVAHARGVVHCDLKPDNVMITGEGKEITARLIDWGISRMARRPPPTEGVAAGTPHYMAPEQVRGQVVDGRTDIYALGVLAYELLTGSPPFDGASPMEIAVAHLGDPPAPLDDRCDALPRRLCELVHSMLAKSRAGRPSLEHAAAALSELVRDLRHGQGPDRVFIDHIAERPARIRWTPTQVDRDAILNGATVHERKTRPLPHKPPPRRSH